MPSRSAAQHRAMEAAAHGQSTLGIPRKVGAEFSRADKGRSFDSAGDPPPTAAGTVFVSPDGAVLLLLRSPSEANYAGHWALPGGGGEPGETPVATAAREAEEEMGYGTRHAWVGEPTLLQETETPTGMVFSTFVQPCRYRFVPELNGEHSGYAWVAPSALPTPMHPAVLATLRSMYATEAATAAQDDADGEKFTKASVDYSPGKGDHRCERCEHWEQGRCALVAGVIDPDYWCEKFEFNVASDSVAMDEFMGGEGSVRTKDADGHLHVARTPLSKAIVNEYYGREVPHWRDLRLDPDRRYRLLRDPVELAKGAETFNGLPLLRRHVRTSAEDYQQDEVVGATGTEAAFEAPYLTNALVVWSQEDIDSIESGEKRELSASYGYRADMTPGTYEGAPYDGVMRDIVGNHVALVIQGRAGPDVVVGDELPPGLATTVPNSGVPALGRKKAEDDASGKYSERDREAASRKKGHREEMPESAFLDPEARKYPVKEKKDGDWVYDRDLLLGAAREARMHGHEDIAKRADAIREREFKDKTGKDGDTMTKAKDGEDLPVPGGGKGKGPGGDRKARDAEPDKKEELKERLKDKMSAEDWKAACDSIDDLVKEREKKADDEKDDDEEADDEEDRHEAKDKKAKDAEKEDDDPDPEHTNSDDAEPSVSKKAMDEAIDAAVSRERERANGVVKAREAVRSKVGELHLAFDSADDVYAAALKALGVDVKGVHPSAYPAMLKMAPAPGAGRRTERSPALAMDGAHKGSSFAERFPDAARVRVGPAR